MNTPRVEVPVASQALLGLTVIERVAQQVVSHGACVLVPRLSLFGR
jgi:hypothetical protein